MYDLKILEVEYILLWEQMLRKFLFLSCFILNDLRFIVSDL